MKKDRPEAAKGQRERQVEYESGFASAFLRRDKRDRFLQVAGARRHPVGGSPAAMKRWTRYCQMLSGLEHWLLEEVMSSAQRTSTLAIRDVLDRLVRIGAPDECYAMSTTTEVDGRFLPLAEAVSRLSSGDNDCTLLICSPASLAYYWHGEIADLTSILQRPARA